MDYIDINSKLHCFEKQNVVTLKDNKGLYDLYKCKYCGLEGKRYGISNQLLVDVTLKKVKLCDGRKIEEGEIKDEVINEINNKSLGKVKLLRVPPVIGNDNLKTGDIVDIIETSSRGVWVKGIEPTEELKKLDSSYEGKVLLLYGEFEEVK